MPELIALLKASPGMACGTSGVGGAGHLAAELLQAMAGVRMTHVPLLFSSMATAIPFVQGGKINALAVTSTIRAAALPDVPTVAEQGLAGFEASLWFGMVGPARLPADIVARVNAAQNAALADPAVQAAIRKQGYEAQPGSPADLARPIRGDGEKWARVIRDAKIAFD